MIEVLVCEDDNISLEVNKAYVRSFGEKYREKVDIISSNGKDELGIKVDIAILDIDLNGRSGIDLAKKLLLANKATVIIFITNHTEYALDAYKIQAFGYLVKPVEQSEFESLFVKAIIQVKSIKNKSVISAVEFYEDRKIIKIKQKDIIYIEKCKNKRKIIIKTQRREYTSNDSIQSFEGKLESEFIKISQSVIVNASEIALIEKKSVLLKTGEQFKINRTYTKEAKRRYEELARR